MGTRAHMAADAVESARAEGLEPGATVIETLDRWGRGRQDIYPCAGVA